MATPEINPRADRTEVSDGRLLVAIGPELETCLVALVGELDLDNVSTLKQELHRLLADDPARRVILDLEALEFIDSSGIRCLLETTMESRADGDRFGILDAVHPHVERVLRISGVREALPFVGGAGGLRHTQRV